jgi:hypothetical protein
MSDKEMSIGGLS